VTGQVQEVVGSSRAALPGKGRTVCHFSSVHPANDIRVYYKECVSIADAGFDTTLIAVAAPVPQGAVRVLGLEATGSRLQRMVARAWRVWRTAKGQGAQIYHFHDPELLPYGLLLKWRTGARVVYDSHENYVEDIQSKVWLTPAIRPVLARIFKVFESFIVRRLDLVVAATPHIAERFAPDARRVVTINNFPDRDEFAHLTYSAPAAVRDGICYIGAITFARGIAQMLDALDLVDGPIRFDLAGRFANGEVERFAKAHRNWHRVTYHGQIDRQQIASIFSRSFAGLVTLLPVPNHIYAQPIKLFEYMAAGLPAIASDFAMWREIVVDGQCGFCVDPEDPLAIASAINLLFADRERAEMFGRNGRRLIYERYNWTREGEKLVKAYDDLLSARN